MSNIFDGVKKYAGSWELVQVVKFDDEDLATFEPIATIVKSTYGKSFKFITKGTKYQMYLSADEGVTLPIGSEVPLVNLRIAILHKDGYDDIKKVRVVEVPRI